MWQRAVSTAIGGIILPAYRTWVQMLDASAPHLTWTDLPILGNEAIFSDLGACISATTARFQGHIISAS